MDSNGYPDDEELRQIEEWPWQDISGLFDFIRPLWAYADAGYWRQDDADLELSTAGWSGNEDIIGALKRNTMVWMHCWYSSRRGGHYEFKLRKVED